MLALQASSQTVQVSSSEAMWQKLIQEMHGQIERLEGEVSCLQEGNQKAREEYIGELEGLRVHMQNKISENEVLEFRAREAESVRL